MAMKKLTVKQVKEGQLLPGGLTVTDLGLRYSKQFNALMLHTLYLHTVYSHHDKKVIYLPFYINNLPVWHHINTEGVVEVYDLW